MSFIGLGSFIRDTRKACGAVAAGPLGQNSVLPEVTGVKLSAVNVAMHQAMT
jgi:hypothetical protein